MATYELSSSSSSIIKEIKNFDTKLSRAAKKKKEKKSTERKGDWNGCRRN
jgi:hypothetical protein